MLCALCSTETPKASSLRCSGLDLCQQCGSDPLPAIESLHSVKPGILAAGRLDANKAREYGIRVDLSSSPQASSLAFQCVRQRLRHKLIKIFVDEIEVGDDLFDDLVYVSTRDRDKTQRLFATDGVQGAVLALVAGMESDADHLTLRDGTLTWRLTSRTGYTLEDWVSSKREFAVLIHWILTKSYDPFAR